MPEFKQLQAENAQLKRDVNALEKLLEKATKGSGQIYHFTPEDSSDRDTERFIAILGEKEHENSALKAEIAWRDEYIRKPDGQGYPQRLFWEELEQLKAHNRQLVEALEAIKKGETLKPKSYENIGGMGWRERKMLASDALQAPPTKLALAEVEVLRAAEAYYRAMNDAYSDGSFEEEQLTCAVEAMQEAKDDA